MEIREVVLKERLPQIPAGIVAFDLEVANSFRDEPAVICMIGVESHDPAQGQCLFKIASIARRDEEKALVEWFLDEVARHKERHPDAALLSFSGLENDVPWLCKRLERLRIVDPERSILRRVGHIDLKAEFYRRTHNEQISLKNLERIFGIERESTVQSRKVSFILTDVVRREQAESAIPEKIYRYLQEDVHNLLLIYNRWGEVSFEEFRLTDVEYLGHVNSLRNAVKKLLPTLAKRRGAAKAMVPPLERFQHELEREVDRALVANTFARFVLPPLPELTLEHPEIERIQKKHRRLAAMALRDEKTGAYLLRGKLKRPRGALAVVRHRGALLMIRRADNLKRAAGYWGLPGGALEEGESPAEGAVRELHEELNLAGRPGRELGTSTSVTGEFTLYWVEVRVDDIATLRPAMDEVAEVRWVKPGQVAGLDPLIPGALEGFRRFLGKEWG